MPWQFVYTSAPSGLVPGRSGFCVVARHRAIPEGLVSALERISIYEPLAGARCVIFNYRLQQIAGNSHGILSRYCDAGLDYTSRRNYLVHHLVFTTTEMATLPPPAEIARRWTGWISTWEGAPRWLDDSDAMAFDKLRQRETSLPCTTWKKLSGDGANALLPCPSGIPVDTTIITPSGTSATETVLRLFAESALLLRGGPWTCGFATQIQQTDIPTQMPWRAADNPEALAGTRNVLVLASLGPSTDISPLAKIAREGQPPPPPVKPRLSPRHRSPDPAYTARNTGTHTALPSTIGSQPLSTDAATNDDTRTHKNFPGSMKLLIAISICSLVLLVTGIALLRPDNSDFKPSPTAETNTGSKKNTLSIRLPDAISQKEIFDSETLKRDLDSAIAKGDWLAAAEHWKKLKAQHPSFTARFHGEYWPPIKAKIAGAHLDALEQQLGKAAAGSFLPEETIINLRQAYSNARTEIAELDAELPQQTAAAFDKIAGQLAFLESLPSTTAVEIAFLNWSPPPSHNQTPPGTHSGFIQLPSYRLPEVLAENTSAPLKLTIDTIDTCTELRPSTECKTTPAQTATLEPHAKATSVSRGSRNQKNKITIWLTEEPSRTPLFMLTRTAKEPFRLERNPVNPTQTPFETLLRSGNNLRLTVLRKPDAQKNVPQNDATFFLISPQKPPSPLKAPRSLLVETRSKKTLYITSPNWLSQTLRKRFPILNTRNTNLSLMPKEDLELAQFFNGEKLTLDILSQALSEAHRDSTAQARSILEEIKKYENSRRTASPSSLSSIDGTIALQNKEYEKIKKHIEKLEARQKQIQTQNSEQTLGKNTPYLLAIHTQNGAHHNILPLILFE